MTQWLPPNLLALFAPRDPIPFKPPPSKLPHEKRRQPYPGVADYVQHFEKAEETPAPVEVESREERRERKRKEKAELQAYRIEQGIALWEPQNNDAASEDPYKTLFVARINYETSESKLRREFEAYGPIKKVSMVADPKTGKPRGYAFIEYERERDMHAAYKHADGRKIDGRRVLVDVERGRTVKGWLPRRLGGGLGNTRKAREAGAEEQRESRRREESSSRSERSSRAGDERRSDRDRDRDRRDDDRRRDDRRRDDRDRDRDRDRRRERERDDRDDYKRRRSEDRREERRPPKEERSSYNDGPREDGELDPNPTNGNH